MSEIEIKNKIEEVKKEMSEVKGTPCEVWSRVVGYLRPVQGFNVGKKEEYGMRKTYDVEGKLERVCKDRCCCK